MAGGVACTVTECDVKFEVVEVVNIALTCHSHTSLSDEMKMKSRVYKYFRFIHPYQVYKSNAVAVLYNTLCAKRTVF